MVTFSQKLTDGMERARIVMLWAARIEATKMSRSDFCDKYAIDEGQLSRWINGKNGPEWPSIETIENALAKEGV